MVKISKKGAAAAPPAKTAVKGQPMKKRPVSNPAAGSAAYGAAAEAQHAQQQGGAAPEEGGALRNKSKQRKQLLLTKLAEEELAAAARPAVERQPPSKKAKKGASSESASDEDEEEEEDALPSTSARAHAANGAAAGAGAEPFKNKEKVLVLSTRGITFRYRHLMDDLLTLLPHSKKDNKLDTKNDRGVLNEVADMKSCSSVVFFEVRKKQDLYIWMSKTPHGPSVKFHVTNVHTMAELKLSGNHLKGSRPILSFHKAFDDLPHLQLLKELLTQVYATPRRHHKSKPFIDHIVTFGLADNRIWVRNYQMVVPLDKGKPDQANMSMVEVGPRMCMNPVKIFAGSFGGATLYENPVYNSPNATRAAVKKQKAGRYVDTKEQKDRRKQHVADNPMLRDELDDTFKN